MSERVRSRHAATNQRCEFAETSPRVVRNIIPSQLQHRSSEPDIHVELPCHRVAAARGRPAIDGFANGPTFRLERVNMRMFRDRACPIAAITAEESWETAPHGST